VFYIKRINYERFIRRATVVNIVTGLREYTKKKLGVGFRTGVSDFPPSFTQPPIPWALDPPSWK
jgi:hypothetical protein